MTASLAFSNSNTAGNWIAVCVRAGNSGQNFSVKDSQGNIYKRAVQLNVTTDAPYGNTVGIFYAENIAGGANAVTVSDSIPGTLRFAIFEYSGLAVSNSLDAVVVSQGSGTSPSSGNVTTTSGGDLVLSAIVTAGSENFTAGSNYTIEARVPAEPGTKLIAEDRVQTTAGVISANATLGTSDPWGAVLAAFRSSTDGGSQPPSAPSITKVSPTSGAVSTQVTIAGTNFAAAQGTSTVKFNGAAATPTSWSATSIVAPVPTGTTTGNVVVTVSGVASNGVPFTVSPSGSGMGPLKQSSVNSRYLIDPAGRAVFLSGSHTWDNFQDTDTGGTTPAAFDFNAYVNFLKAHNQNATILWRKDLPEYCNWDFSGSVWKMAPWPWPRTGPGVASDGNPKFDLAQFDQAFFDRLRARALQLQQNNIYAIIQLFDPEALTTFRCSTDGYPFTGTNNVNGVDDGYRSGSCGVGSVTMTTNDAITQYQDAYLKKVIDTLNDLPNVFWEVAEEQPGTSFSSCPGYGGASSMTFWAPHMFGLIKTYEAGGTWEGITYPGKAFQHPAGIGSMNYGDRVGGDATLYASTAPWIAPSINSGVDKFPSNVPVNNQGKVVLNDSDHALGWHTFLNSDGSVQNQNLRGYLWENLTNGAEGVLFMDPYEVFWQSTPMRNTCLNSVHHICNGVDAKYDPFRSAMGNLQNFVNSNLNLLRMTPQNSLASTGHCLADNSATGAEYVVYAPSGGTFTLNLSATTRVLNVQWLNPATGAVATASSVTGGSTLSFTPPFSGDAVLYLTDAAGHN